MHRKFSEFCLQRGFQLPVLVPRSPSAEAAAETAASVAVEATAEAAAKSSALPVADAAADAECLQFVRYPKASRLGPPIPHPLACLIL